MAQKISPLATRLSLNRSSDSIWFDSISTEKAIKLDIQYRHFLYSIGSLISKSNNSSVLRTALSSSHENTHLECFIASQNLLAEEKNIIPQSIFSKSSKHGEDFPSFRNIINLNLRISQKLCALYFLQNYIKGEKALILPYNDKNYRISFLRVNSEFQSAAFVALNIAQDLSKGKSVNQSFSEISRKYSMNPILYNFIKGFRIQCKGRISNQEEASTETLEIGRIARGKFDDRVDYTSISTKTSLGLIGIKVWLNYYI